MRAAVIQALEKAKGAKAVRLSQPSLVRIGTSTVNVRTANEKAGDSYWFDVTPSYFRSVNFFLFACGSATTVYVFPAAILEKLVKNASLGGQKQVPNFTIYVDRHRFEPAGRSIETADIRMYLNNYGLVQ
jgi:hypothetical protein